MATSTVIVRLFDGAAQPFPAGTKVLLTVTDGNQKQIVRQYFNAAQIEVDSLPFYDNLGDNYAVIAFVEGYEQAGFAPVHLTPQAPVTVDLMLAPENLVFNFAGLTWDLAKQKMPFLAAAPGQSDQDAQDRFSQMMETNSSKPLACMMNLVTAMNAMDFGGPSPVTYIRQVRWDSSFPAQDRFFAYCDESLVEATRAAALKGLVAVEPGAGLFHPGATLSWKQIQFPESNVQLTFHTNPIDCVPANNWVTVEPDIDYYKDLLNHGILEVARNQLTGSLTEPAQVYVLRWIEQRRMGLPDFTPGYTLRSA